MPPKGSPTMPTSLRCMGLALALLVNGSIFAQAPIPDHDHDGMNDILEQQLALRFAPEWRFNEVDSRSGSFWNFQEATFPASLEWFHQEAFRLTGHYPSVCFYDRGPGGLFPPRMNRRCVPLTDMNLLSSTTDPNPPHRRADDPFWIQPDNLGLVGLEEYPREMVGYPDVFPTYFECYKESGSNEVGIGYYLWFPYDYAPSPVGIGEQSHRGDWVGIKVRLSGIADLTVQDIPDTATIKDVIYSGHKLPRKLVPLGQLRVVDQTHPQVFVSQGSHALYPEPGGWRNLIVGVFDDFFLGNGFVARSWMGGRELMNLGEHNYADCDGVEGPDGYVTSLNGWMGFAGMWGPDGSTEQGSPFGPVWGAWCRDDGSPQPWALIKTGGPGHAELDPDIFQNHGLEAEGPRRAVFLLEENWGNCFVPAAGGHTCVGLPKGCGYFGFFNPDDPAFCNVVDLPDPLRGLIHSFWLLGGAQVRVSDAHDLGEPSYLLTHSCPDLENHFDHGFGGFSGSMREVSDYSVVFVDRANRDGYQDGSSQPQALGGPVATIGRAAFLADQNAVVHIAAGTYPEILTITKPMQLIGQGGVVVIGRF